jgi:hypothetical protein
MPEAPTKVEVVRQLAQRREIGGGKRRHVERNKCLAAMVTKRKNRRGCLLRSSLA